jgi:hypothetical protein
MSSTLAQLTLIITNKPPVFLKPLPETISIKFNSKFEYILPTYADPEKMPINVTLNAVPMGIINEFATVSSD